MIDKNLLKKYHAVSKSLSKGEMLVQEGEKAVFYYQILTGVIKMNNYNDDGQETIQGLFKSDESFGEPAMLGDFPFPANVIAVEETHLICLEKHHFFRLLEENPSVSLTLLSILSRRLRFKAILAKEIKGHNAKHQIMALLHFLKKKANITDEYQVEITRQTIANLTGLRVETVIRAIKQLAGKGLLRIEKRKLYL